MKVSRSALVPFSAGDMFAVVADIQSYPDFLNWCESVDVVSQQENEIIASLAISYSKLSFKFTTRNVNTPNETIQLNLHDGPFSQLQGVWRFIELNETACKVTLDMDFDFDNAIARSAFGGVFKKIISAQLDAFQKRAESLYGRSYHASN